MPLASGSRRARSSSNRTATMPNALAAARARVEVLPDRLVEAPGLGAVDARALLVPARVEDHPEVARRAVEVGEEGARQEDART